MSIDTETLRWLQSSPSGYISAAKAVQIAWQHTQSSQEDDDFPFSPIPTAISLYPGTPPVWVISFTYESPHDFAIFPNNVCVSVDALAGTPEFLLLE